MEVFMRQASFQAVTINYYYSGGI